MKLLVTLWAFTFCCTFNALKISSLQSLNSTTHVSPPVNIKNNSSTICSNNTAVGEAKYTQNTSKAVNISTGKEPISENEQKGTTKPYTQKQYIKRKVPNSETATTKPAPTDDSTNQLKKKQFLSETQKLLSKEKKQPQETQSSAKIQNPNVSSSQTITIPQSKSDSEISDQLNPLKKNFVQVNTQVQKVPNPPLPVPGLNIEEKPNQKPLTSQKKSQPNNEESQKAKTKSRDSTEWSKKDQEQFEEWRSNLIPVSDPKLLKEFNKQIQKEKERRMENKKK